MALKLKSLLEGYAWERKADGSLPTLKDSIAVHEANEANSALETKIAKFEKEIADIKHQYYSVSNLSPEREETLVKRWSNLDRELKRAKRERKTGAEGYQGNPLKKEPKDRKPERWQDNDGDGKWYEPGVDVKENVNEGHNDHGVLDMISEAENVVQRLRSNMATNSVLQGQEKMGYLRAFDELLDILSEIGYQSEME